MTGNYYAKIQNERMLSQIATAYYVNAKGDFKKACMYNFSWTRNRESRDVLNGRINGPLIWIPSPLTPVDSEIARATFTAIERRLTPHIAKPAA